LIASQYSLVCATPEFYSIKGLQRLSLFINNIAERHDTAVLGVLLSFWNPRGKSNDAFLKVIDQTFPGKLLQAKVRRDIAVSEATIYGRPIFQTSPKARASEDYVAVTSELLKRMG
jgi:chromosome partitioning protein